MRSITKALAIYALSATLVHADSAIPDGFKEVAEFRTEDVGTEATNDKFGGRVAMVPGFAAVAGAEYSDPVTQNGEVFLFRLNAGAAEPMTFIKALDRQGDFQTGDRRGTALTGHGDWIGVTQNRDDIVTLHQRNQGGTNNWGIVTFVEEPVLPFYRPDSFGGSGELPTIDLHGSLLIVADFLGDRMDETSGTEIENRAGFAFVFERDAGGTNNWGLVATLQDPSPDLDDIEGFGKAVAIYDGETEDIAVVGAPDTDIDDSGSNRDGGEAYVFTRAQGSTQWTLSQTLIGDGLDGRQASDSFGRSLGVSENTIAVGTSNGWNVASNAGSVHFYSRDEGGSANWGEVLEIGEGGFIDDYSRALELESDRRIIVGAPGDDMVYIYERDEMDVAGWGDPQVLQAVTTETGDAFGSGVGILNGFAVVGARDVDSRDGMISRSGAAFGFLDDLIFCDDFEPEIPPIE